MQTIFQTIKKTVLGMILTVFFVGVMTCTTQKADDNEGKYTMASQTVQQVLKKHTNELMSIPGVVGTAQGLCDGQPCIKVLVIQKTPEIEEKIPETLEGYPVEIEPTGEIKPLPKNQD
jgi:hypothetical protein